MRLYSTTPLLLTAAFVGGLRLCELRLPASPAARATPSLAFDDVPRAGRGDSVAIVTLHVEGMTCGGCVIGVRKVLTRLDGVTKADVSYETKRAVVRYDPAKVGPKQMIDAIATLRYTASVVPAAPAPAGATTVRRPAKP